MKKKTIQRWILALLGLICIGVLAIAIPNVIVWKYGGLKKAPDGAVITHNGKRHLVLVDKRGNVTPYIESPGGNFVKAK